MFKRWSVRLLALLATLLLGTTSCTEPEPADSWQAPVSLREKIGQMLMFGFKGMALHDGDPIFRALRRQEIGGVVLYDYDIPTQRFDRNIQSPAQLKALTHQLQAIARKAAERRGNTLIPLLIGLDYEGGKVNRLKPSYCDDKHNPSTCFPSTLSAAEIGRGSLAEARQAAARMAQTLKANGFNLNFAPVLDVNVNPESPAIGKVERSFSDDSDKVTGYARVFSKAYQQAGIACTYKHFPGHGSAKGDTHWEFVDVTNTWQEDELNPYQKLLREPDSCALVMPAHIVNRKLDKQGYPADLSQAIVTDLLKNKLKFRGVVITDDLQMKAIADHYGTREAVRRAINAGADILVFANQILKDPRRLEDPADIVNIIEEEVKAGHIPESRIEASYQRILALKKHKINQSKIIRPYDI